jgi:hypothetical protein
MQPNLFLSFKDPLIKDPPCGLAKDVTFRKGYCPYSGEASCKRCIEDEFDIDIEVNIGDFVTIRDLIDRVRKEVE